VLACPILLFAICWIASGLVWVAFAVSMLFAEGEQAPDGAGKAMRLVFPMFGLPFVIVGLVMVSSPFWAWWQARRTVHVFCPCFDEPAHLNPGCRQNPDHHEPGCHTDCFCSSCRKSRWQWDAAFEQGI